MTGSFFINFISNKFSSDDKFSRIDFLRKSQLTTMQIVVIKKKQPKLQSSSFL